MSAVQDESPDVRITIKNGIPSVKALAPNITVEVRGYDVQGKTHGIWHDENNKPRRRYLIKCDVRVHHGWRESLEQFASDLREHASIAAMFTTDSDPNGLHVLSINKVDYFFYADGSGYDGWGRAP